MAEKKVLSDGMLDNMLLCKLCHYRIPRDQALLDVLFEEVVPYGGFTHIKAQGDWKKISVEGRRALVAWFGQLDANDVKGEVAFWKKNYPHLWQEAVAHMKEMKQGWPNQPVKE